MRRSLLNCLILLTGLMAFHTPSQAHPLAPALLEITHVQDSRFSVLWRLSAVQIKGVAPQPVLPTHCTQSKDMSIQRETGLAVASRWEVRCRAPSLSNDSIAIQGLDRNPINVVLRIRTAEGALIQTLLDGNNSKFIVPTPELTASVFARYLSLGIEHLIFGPDHLLFLLALIILVGMKRKLVLVLTAFTLGHSVTLTLASLNIISANPALMELGIALSLVIAARELLREAPSALGRHTATMAAVFGLLHGMGFAGALQDIGLPSSDLISALLAFNIGIELAQLAIVAFLFVSLRVLSKIRNTRRLSLTSTLPAYLIGTLAMLWCIERTAVVLL